jgi:hypothetical protein
MEDLGATQHDLLKSCGLSFDHFKHNPSQSHVHGHSNSLSTNLASQVGRLCAGQELQCRSIMKLEHGNPAKVKLQSHHVCYNDSDMF